jgi:hypothetical protein
MMQRECLDAGCHVWCGLLHLPGPLIGIEQQHAATCNSYSVIQMIRSEAIQL